MRNGITELLQLAGKEQCRRASTQPLRAQHLSAPLPQLHSACYPHFPSPTVPVTPASITPSTSAPQHPSPPPPRPRSASCATRASPAINLHTFLHRCPRCLEQQTNDGGVQQPLSRRTAGCSMCTLFHHPPRAQNRTKLLFSQPSVCSPALPAPRTVGTQTSNGAVPTTAHTIAPLDAVLPLTVHQNHPGFGHTSSSQQGSELRRARKAEPPQVLVPSETTAHQHGPLALCMHSGL